MVPHSRSLEAPTLSISDAFASRLVRTSGSGLRLVQPETIKNQLDFPVLFVMPYKLFVLENFIL
jgi:hypothetical protein